MKRAAPKKSGASKRRTPEKTSFEKAAQKHDVAAIASEISEDFLTNDELGKIISHYPPDYQFRLRNIYEEWKSGKLTNRDKIKELIKAGIIKDYLNTIEGSNLPITCGWAALQKILQTKFPGHGDFNHNDVRRWKKGYPGNEMGNPDIPPFPPTEGENVYRVQACIDWVQRWIVETENRKNVGGMVSGSIRDQLLASDLRKADRAERKEKGELISTAVVENYIGGIGARIAGHVDKLIEDKPGLRAIVRAAGLSLGISEETLDQLDSKLAVDFVAANDALKAEFRVMKEAADKFMADLRAEQMKKS